MKKLTIKSNTSHSLPSIKAVYSVAGFLLLTTIISGAVLLSSPTYASTEEQTNVSVIVNSACTITTGGGSYAKLISPGTTAEIAGNGINVTCNDSNGYALYTAGYSGNEYNTTNSTKMLAASGSNAISTGTSGSDSYWAMKATGSSSLSPSTAPTIDNSFGSYQAVPSTFTKISHYGGATEGTTTNSVTTPSYQVYVASAQAADTYTGKVKYLLVHPNSNNNPIVNMQNWTGCSNMSTGDSTYLIDTRDKQAYNVIKFSDGKCWMTTNLNLAGGTALSATDTDVTSDYINSFTTSNNLTKNDNTIVLPASSTTGFDTDNYSYVFNSGKTGTNCSTPGCYSYYSWDAATLGSGRNISTNNTDAEHSICPKGWRLPSSKSNLNDFANLSAVISNNYKNDSHYDNNTNPTGTEMFDMLSSVHFNPLLSSSYSNSSFDKQDGRRGIYWYSTSYSSANQATYFDFIKGAEGYLIRLTLSANRSIGFALRCLTE